MDGSLTRWFSAGIGKNYLFLLSFSPFVLALALPPCAALVIPTEGKIRGPPAWRETCFNFQSSTLPFPAATPFHSLPSISSRGAWAEGTWYSRHSDVEFESSHALFSSALSSSSPVGLNQVIGLPSLSEQVRNRECGGTLLPSWNYRPSSSGRTNPLFFPPSSVILFSRPRINPGDPPAQFSFRDLRSGTLPALESMIIPHLVAPRFLSFSSSVVVFSLHPQFPLPRSGYNQSKIDFGSIS